MLQPILGYVHACNLNYKFIYKITYNATISIKLIQKFGDFRNPNIVKGIMKNVFMCRHKRSQALATAVKNANITQLEIRKKLLPDSHVSKSII